MGCFKHRQRSCYGTGNYECLFRSPVQSLPSRLPFKAAAEKKTGAAGKENIPDKKIYEIVFHKKPETP